MVLYHGCFSWYYLVVFASDIYGMVYHSPYHGTAPFLRRLAKCTGMYSYDTTDISWCCFGLQLIYTGWYTIPQPVLVPFFSSGTGWYTTACSTVALGLRSDIIRDSITQPVSYAVPFPRVLVYTTVHVVLFCAGFPSNARICSLFFCCHGTEFAEMSCCEDIHNYHRQKTDKE
ncbi:unnamed protein product, partial [Laminaria digitata]